MKLRSAWCRSRSSLGVKNAAHLAGCCTVQQEEIYWIRCHLEESRLPLERRTLSVCRAPLCFSSSPSNMWASPKACRSAGSGVGTFLSLMGCGIHRALSELLSYVAIISPAGHTPPHISLECQSSLYTPGVKKTKTPNIMLFLW